MNIDTSHGHPAMDYRAHFGTYRGFLRTAVWGTAILAVILIFMAIFLV